MASEAPPDEAPAPSTEMEEAAPPREDALPSETDVARVAALEEEPEAAPDQPAPEGTAPEQPTSGGASRSRKLRPQEAGVRRGTRRTRPSIARLTRVVGGAGAGEVAAVGAVQPTRPHPPKQSSLRRTKLEKSMTTRTSLLTGRVAVAVAVAGGVRRPLRPLTTLWTL